jgi:hypothetical protein
VVEPGGTAVGLACRNVIGMPHVVEARVRVLAVGIRPTFAAECGVPLPGMVDILDAYGISGWQIGIRQLLSECSRAGRRNERLLDWGRAELEADLVRWHHLAAFATTLRRAAATWAAGAHDDHDTLTFWRGWRRNVAHAHSLLAKGGLIVSPVALALLHEVHTAVLPGAGRFAGDLPELMGRLREAASAQLSPQATDPPPLVLPGHRALLTAALSA